MFPFFSKTAAPEPTFEAALAMNQSYDALRGHVRDALRTDHGVTGYSDNGPYIMDMFPSHVVYQYNNQMFKRPYTATAKTEGTTPTVKLGKASKVHVAYLDTAGESIMAALITPPESWKEDAATYEAKRSVTVTSEALPEGAILVAEKIKFADIAMEGVSTKPRTAKIKILGPGWGSSAYYSEAMLRESGPQAFKSKTHMYLNHPTRSDEVDIPERRHEDLAAVLTEDAFYDPKGWDGAGLYSEALVFSDHEKPIAEKAPYTGVSLVAAIQAHAGEAEGKKGKIGDKFIYAYSVDFVTRPGAKGAIQMAHESRREALPQSQQQGAVSMTPEEITQMEALRTQLATANLDNARLRRLELGADAFQAASKRLKEAGIPFNTAILHRVCANPVITTEGKVDANWLAGIVTEFAAEVSGEVTNQGALPLGVRLTEANIQKNLDDQLKEALEGLGVPKTGLEVAIGRG